MLRPVNTLERLDWVVVALYFVTVFGVAAWATVSERREQTSSTDYFLAGRNVGWFVIGASLFASNIGSEHLVGLAGTGAASGVAVGQFEILASLILLVLGWVFVPFYLRSGVFTMPEFLERRYSPAARWYLAVISIVGYVLTKISVTIAAGGIVFESLMGIDFWTGALVVVVATGIYTVLGGLRAVLYTDLLQMFVLVGGAVAVTWIGLGELGGWGAMVEEAGPGFMSVWKPLSDPDFPWTGILLGAPIPVHRSARAVRGGRGQRSAGNDLRRAAQAVAALHLRRTWRRRPRARIPRGDHPRQPGPGAPHPHRRAAAAGHPGAGGRRAARSADELAVVGLQFLLHPLH
jgi:Na+(H+)/acetate symporter ActP